MRQFILVVVFALGAAPLWAADQAGAPMATPPVMLGQVALGLLFVVGVILLLAWVLKKLAPGAGQYSKSMRVVATLPLGAREKAALVQVGDQQMLLGVAPGRVTCLHVFDEPVVTSVDAGSGAPANDFAGKFKEILNQRLGRS